MEHPDLNFVPEWLWLKLALQWGIRRLQTHILVSKYIYEKNVKGEHIINKGSIVETNNYLDHV